MSSARRGRGGRGGGNAKAAAGADGQRSTTNPFATPAMAPVARPATYSGFVPKATSSTATTGRQFQPARGTSRGGRSSARRGDGGGLEKAQRSTSSTAGMPYDQRYQVLKKRREQERIDAIANGFLADPDKPRKLDDAITPVGTCPDMCAEFERVERVVQKDFWEAERDPDSVARGETGSEPVEHRMVKKFRRAAAGIDEQLPSDLRPPAILQKTMDYLISDVILRAESLSSVHHFLWDRTRAIRNDFSIQQVSEPSDLMIAIDCYERIVRLHLTSLHSFADPEMETYDGYDWHQEREQLDKALLSLHQYYDDAKGMYASPNEAEFRAISIIFQIHSSAPHIEDRVQDWPLHILRNPKVRRALQLYAAACNSEDLQGPLRPPARHPVAQSNIGRFWQLIAAHDVSFMMACVAELYFNKVRRNAITSIWNAYRLPGNKTTEDWTIAQLRKTLGFDDDEQTLQFVDNQRFQCGTRADGQQFVDLASLTGRELPKPNMTNDAPTFSRRLVDAKRYGRLPSAIINGLSMREAREQQLLEQAQEDDSLFVSSGVAAFQNRRDSETTGGEKTPILNPFASTFKPTASTSTVSAPSPFSANVTSNPFGAPSTTTASLKPNPFAPKATTFDNTNKNPFAKTGESASTAPQPTFPSPFATTNSDTNVQSPFASNTTATSTSPFGFANTTNPAANNAQPQRAATNPMSVFAPKATDPEPKSFFNPFQSKSATETSTIPASAPEATSIQPPSQPSTAAPALNLGSFAPRQSEATQQAKPAGFSLPSATATTSSSPFSAQPSSVSRSENPSTAGFSSIQIQPSLSQPLLSQAQSGETSHAESSSIPFPPSQSSPFSQPFSSQSSSNPLFASKPATSMTTQAATSTSGFPSVPGQSSASQQRPAASPSPPSVSSANTGVAAASESIRNDFSNSRSSAKSVSFAPAIPSPLSQSPLAQSARTPEPKLTARPDFGLATPASTIEDDETSKIPEVSPLQNRNNHRAKILGQITSDLFYTEHDGILSQFLENQVGMAIFDAQRLIKDEQAIALADQFRSETLAKRYGQLWATIFWREHARRKGAEIREKLKQSRMDWSKSVKQSQSQDHVQGLRLAAASRDKSRHRLSRSLASSEFPPHSEHQMSSEATQKSPRKRSHEEIDDSPARYSNSQPDLHSISAKKRAFKVPPAPRELPRSYEVARSLLSSQSPNSPDRRKRRTTQTDYFKLKAMGVNPDSYRALSLTPSSYQLSGSWAVGGRHRSRSAASSIRFETPSREVSLEPSTAGKFSSSWDRRGATPERAIETVESKPPSPEDPDEDLFAQARQLRRLMADSTSELHAQSEELESEFLHKISPPDGSHASTPNGRRETRLSDPSRWTKHLGLDRPSTSTSVVGSLLGTSGPPSVASGSDRPKYWSRKSKFVPFDKYGTGGKTSPPKKSPLHQRDPLKITKHSAEGPSQSKHAGFVSDMPPASQQQSIPAGSPDHGVQDYRAADSSIESVFSQSIARPPGTHGVNTSFGTSATGTHSSSLGNGFLGSTSVGNKTTSSFSFLQEDNNMSSARKQPRERTADDVSMLDAESSSRGSAQSGSQASASEHSAVADEDEDAKAEEIDLGEEDSDGASGSKVDEEEEEEESDENAVTEEGGLASLEYVDDAEEGEEDVDEDGMDEDLDEEDGGSLGLVADDYEVASQSANGGSMSPPRWLAGGSSLDDAIEL